MGGQAVLGPPSGWLTRRSLWSCVASAGSVASIAGGCLLKKHNSASYSPVYLWRRTDVATLEDNRSGSCSLCVSLGRAADGLQPGHPLSVSAIFLGTLWLACVCRTLGELHGGMRAGSCSYFGEVFYCCIAGGSQGGQTLISEYRRISPHIIIRPSLDKADKTQGHGHVCEPLIKPPFSNSVTVHSALRVGIVLKHYWLLLTDLSLISCTKPREAALCCTDNKTCCRGELACAAPL